MGGMLQRLLLVIIVHVFRGAWRCPRESTVEGGDSFRFFDASDWTTGANDP